MKNSVVQQNDGIAESDVVPSFGCSTSSSCIQRSAWGRLARLGSFWLCDSHDITYLRSVSKCCRWASNRLESIGMLKKEWNEFSLREMKETFKTDESELSQVRVHVAELLIQCEEENASREGIKILESGAKQLDVLSMLCLGLVFQFGMNGVQKDEIQARCLYEQCLKQGSSEASKRLEMLGTVKGKLQPVDENCWRMFLLFLRKNIPIACDLNGSGDS